MEARWSTVASISAVLGERAATGMDGVGQMSRDALAAIPIARDFRELVVSLQGLSSPAPTLAAAVEFVGHGPLAADKGPLVGIECLFVNEWGIPDFRVLLISPKACYRVAFSKGMPCRFKRVPHEKVTRIVKCSSPLNKMNTVSESGVQVRERAAARIMLAQCSPSWPATTRSPILCGRCSRRCRRTSSRGACARPPTCTARKKSRCGGGARALCGLFASLALSLFASLALSLFASLALSSWRR